MVHWSGIFHFVNFTFENMPLAHYANFKNKKLTVALNYGRDQLESLSPQHKLELAFLETMQYPQEILRLWALTWWKKEPPAIIAGSQLGLWMMTGRCARVVALNTSTWILKVAILKVKAPLNTELFTSIERQKQWVHLSTSCGSYGSAFSQSSHS